MFLELYFYITFFSFVKKKFLFFFPLLKKMFLIWQNLWSPIRKPGFKSRVKDSEPEIWDYVQIIQLLLVAFYLPYSWNQLNNSYCMCFSDSDGDNICMKVLCDFEILYKIKNSSYFHIIYYINCVSSYSRIIWNN